MSDAPLFEQLAASVRTNIVAGRLHPGDRLPAARELAKAVNANVHTVLRAYQLLRDEGLVELRRGRGAVLTEQSAQMVGLERDIAELVARASALGLSPETLTAMVKEAAT